MSTHKTNKAPIEGNPMSALCPQSKGEVFELTPSALSSLRLATSGDLVGLRRKTRAGRWYMIIA